MSIHLDRWKICQRKMAEVSGAVVFLLAVSQANAEVFISEIHYDNASTDTGEAIEISADLGTDLTGWSVVLYNGANGQSYNTISLNGFAQADASCGSTGGTQVINLPSNGLQNGAPDGLALVDNSGSVVQFLSYEGELIASNGPASGMTSIDIGVSENSSTPVGESLQLVDGSWQAANLSTFGICTTEVSGSVATPAPTPSPAPSSDIFISEIHYDNAGGDSGEAIELSGPVGSDISGWQIVLYNGNDGSPYGTVNLSGSLQEVEGCDAGYTVVNRPGIQNGGPDGLALVDAGGNLVEFLSYEGEFVASGGAADGVNSTDIGVEEGGSTPEGFSLQKIDGSWKAPAENTFGRCALDAVEPPPIGLKKIHEVQGAGNEIAINGVVTVEAIVIADYQAANQLSGFFIQEEDSDVDANPLSSEGIFVFCDSCPVDVAEGDHVRVTGLAQDFFDMSQLRATLADDIEVISGGNSLPSAAGLSLPVPVTATELNSAQEQIDTYFEPVEGMLIRIPEVLSVAEYFELGRYGQVVLAAGGRPRQFTDQSLPSEAGYLAHQIKLQARSIILDDDSSSQNVALFNNSPVFFPEPGLSTENFFRGGDTIENLRGVLHYAFSEWRVRPIESENYQFTAQNTRSEAPTEVGGSLKVASFNVLNYFTTLDEPGTLCAPGQNLGCRGADSAEELYRQTQKIVAAICAIDADILGLMELENPGLEIAPAPIDSLVEAINAECGEYAAVEAGSIGTDAITVGFIYKTDTVALEGNTAILDSASFTDPNNSGIDKNRPAIAQSFVELEKNATITIAVNHFKSKGSSCGAGDDDTTTGQGNCNLTRTMAAQVQAQWLASNPTGVSSDYTLVIGDLNAYRYEDPIAAFESAGYIDLVNLFGGGEAYGFLFDGQLGYLDHGLANEALLPYVTGVTDWHINADEINLLDYNDTVQDASESNFEAKPSATELFAPNAYRSSDHDPLVIGIDLPRAASIAGLIHAYQTALDKGEIKGRGKGPIKHLLSFLFVKDLSAAEWYYDKGLTPQACSKLQVSASLSDGKKQPKDLIRGQGVAAINQMIHKVMNNLACE